MTTDILPARYRDPEPIGRGGMGDIYRATDSSLGRDVAIKILAERYAEDASVRQRFTREALAAARLSAEPNTITIFDVGEHQGRPYIVMEYLAGGSLDDVLREGGPQPPEQALRWLEQAAAALDAAHVRGVVHRDVKPGNLLLDKEHNVHVADFGIASATDMDSLTMTGTVLGTAGYLSPEQAQGQRATPASDRYALAVVAFELLAGSRPFTGDSPTAEAAAHINAPVPSVAERSGLPRALDAVFEHALAKDPTWRYNTCTEFVGALRAAFSHDTRELAVVDDATEYTRPLLRPPVRDRAWPLLAALLAFGAVAGALLAYFLTRGGDEKAAPPPPTHVVTRVQTVTTQGRVRTVERPVTVTAATPTPPASSPSPSSGASGSSLNDAGFAKMRGGDYAGALPLLEQAVQKLTGTNTLTEAYAKYNLAYTRYHLGNCSGVLELLDSSESIQGHRSEIDRLRAQAQNCG
ncbi:MAG: serine/threonine-protein kinase [Gaiellaceae bacterium]